MGGTSLIRREVKEPYHGYGVALSRVDKWTLSRKNKVVNMVVNGGIPLLSRKNREISLAEYSMRYSPLASKKQKMYS